MAYVTIPSSSILPGKPVKTELWTKVKNDLDDHETRILALAGGAAQVSVFDHTVLNAASASTFTGFNYFRATFAFTLTNCEIQIFEKGSLTGNLEVDIKKNTTPNDTGMTTVFTTKPKLVFASISDYAVSSNQVFNGAQIAIASGDILRFDVTEMPASGILSKFRIQLYGVL